MDKNMINIDELVRDRLSGGEEKERTGAWLQMRELLDKKMPVETTPVAFGWKRITGYIAGMVLLVALSVGGYKTMTHGDADNHMADNPAGNAAANDGNGTAASTGNNGHATTGNGSVATVHDAATGKGIGGNPNSTMRNNYGQDNNNTTRPANNNNRSNSNRTNNHNRTTNTANTATGNNHNAGTQNPAGNTVHNAGGHIAKNEHIAGPNNIVDNNGTGSTVSNLASNSGNSHQSDATGNNTGAANIGASVNSVSNTARNNAHSVQPVHPENVQHRHSSDRNASAAVNNGTASNTVVPAAGSNTSNSAATHNLAGNNRTNGGGTGTTGMQNNPANNNVTPAVKKDTLEKIRLVQHYNRRRDPKGIFSMDTIGVEQMIVNRPLESVIPTAKSNNPAAYSTNTARKINPAKAQKDPSDFTMTPAAATTAAKASAGLEADANNNLVPLANYRVASRKMNWDPQRFEEMVNRFKYNIAQLKFYPGIVAGINASMFGPNSFGGFQLGLASTVAFNERLSLAAELKYISRFNSGVSVTDDYAGRPTDSNAIYNAQGTALEYMNYTRDSTHHYFNFSMLHSIELPVSVRYSIGRFFMMGGLNFAYHIKVDAEEIERHLVAQTIVPYNHAPITWPEGKPSISSKDFNSRFAIGGLFGLGYELTPAVQLDIRMTKSLWDNAHTNGAKIVSDQLYKSPSLQLSIGYRFSQQKH